MNYQPRQVLTTLYLCRCVLRRGRGLLHADAGVTPSPKHGSPALSELHHRTVAPSTPSQNTRYEMWSSFTPSTTGCKGITAHEARRGAQLADLDMAVDESLHQSAPAGAVYTSTKKGCQSCAGNDAWPPIPCPMHSNTLLIKPNSAAGPDSCTMKLVGDHRQDFFIPAAKKLCKQPPDSAASASRDAHTSLTSDDDAVAQVLLSAPPSQRPQTEQGSCAPPHTPQIYYNLEVRCRLILCMLN